MMVTTQRPNLVIWSANSKIVYIIELTVPFEENIVWTYRRKPKMYEDLWDQFVRNSWPTNNFPFEVEWRGLFASLTSAYLTKLSLSVAKRKKRYIKKILDQTQMHLQGTGSHSDVKPTRPRCIIRYSLSIISYW